MDLGLTGRTFIATGASRGLGRACVDALVAEGAHVVVSARSAEALAPIEAAHGDAVRVLVADNSAADTPARLIKAATESFGRLDGALLSVGGPPAGVAMDATDAQWSAAFDSVFLGGVRLMREIGGALASGDGGSMVAVLSSSVRVPIPGLSISNGLRPGLAMVAKDLAGELGPDGVRVNGLMPGRVHTERIDELDALSGDAQATRQRIEAKIPLRRYGRPEEFAAVAAFLLSPASSYLTGAMIPVDGGQLPTV